MGVYRGLGSIAAPMRWDAAIKGRRPKPTHRYSRANTLGVVSISGDPRCPRLMWPHTSQAPPPYSKVLLLGNANRANSWLVVESFPSSHQP